MWTNTPLSIEGTPIDDKHRVQSLRRVPYTFRSSRSQFKGPKHKEKDQIVGPLGEEDKGIEKSLLRVSWVGLLQRHY